MDLLGWLMLIAFEGIVGGVAVLLALTYLSFTRMERDVRRARMFIMSDRIQRFLGAFTIGFIVLAATFASGFLGVVLPPGVAVGAFFIFLATIAYGVVELYFIVRPRRTAAMRRVSWRSAFGRNPTKVQSHGDHTEDEIHASR